jgi:Uma2 family endonuclease
MLTPSKRNATYQDVVEAPDNLVAELIGGELFLQPRPAMPHARASSRLGMVLGPPFDLGQGGPGGWFLVDEPEIRLASNIVVPDIAGWRRAEAEGLNLRAAQVEVVPAWVCEIMSPSTQGHDRIRKLPAYAKYGVEHVWLIDPKVQTLEVFRREDTRWVLAAAFGERDEVSVEPFGELSFALDVLWDAESGETSN